MWNTSWGVSTRMIGGLVMTHSETRPGLPTKAGAGTGGDRADLETEEEKSQV